IMVGAGAKVLGSFTVGDGAVIAANAVVLKAVPAGATVVGVPGRVARINGKRVDRLDQKMPDPVAVEIERLNARIDALERAAKG
ncbi:MAG: serine O-acetyltransferase, partial [Oscillospiraceae bacterium]